MASSIAFREIVHTTVSSTIFNLIISLAFGVLFGNKIKCPAHNATFNITDGAPDEGPMLDGL
jgi:nitrite reductase/ring-hydroxylating ferredoxin subunit